MAFIISDPLYRQAYSEIKKSILMGEYHSGQKVVVSKLEAKYKISKTPLREALRQLQNEGLLVQDGNGLSVVTLSHEEFGELCHCRLVLEKEIIQLAMSNITEAQLEKVQGLLKQTKEVLERAGPITEVIELNSRFHEELYSPCTNKRLINLLEQVRSLLFIYRAKISNHATYLPDILQEHQFIYESVKERNLEKTLHLIENHLMNDKHRGTKVVCE
jgi:DNA-binding GntR family transcriptional regulator